MNPKRFLIPPVALLLVVTGTATSERDAWFQRHGEVIANARNDPSPAHIQELGKVIGAMSLHATEYSPEALALFQHAKDTLMSTPGYAEHFRDCILDARAQMEAEPDRMLRDDLYNRTMANAVGGFGILGILPAPASVRVLGDFLSDERGLHTNTPEDNARGFDHHAAFHSSAQAIPASLKSK